MNLWEDGESLTLEKFQEMADQLPPRPEWVGYTVNSAMYHRLLSETRLTNEQIEFGQAWTRDILFEVPNQIGEIVGWSNRDDLNLYLEMMGVSEMKDAAKCDAIRQIAVHSPRPMHEIVVIASTYPACLEEIAGFLGPTPLEYERAKSISGNFFDLLAKAFIAEPEPVKKERISNQPFYAKFVSKKRR